MSFPPSFLEEIRTRLSVSEVVGKRVPLKRLGREFKGCCPFHNEKTPSFHTNDQKGFYHCFGCGAHGDVIGFVMQHDRLSFPEAVETLATQAGLDMPRLSHADVEVAKQQKTLHQLCEAACLFFEQALHKTHGRAALEYLRKRSLTDETIAKFRLGYAPQEGNLLVTHLSSAGYNVEQMIEVGLVRQGEHGRAPYSFFRDRVMFPVADKRGRVVAFGGRIMQSSPDNKAPKYINSPDHPLFHKGQLLYSLSRAREAVAQKKPAIVVEGYMDVISMHEAGFTGAVAPLGTALTEAQIEQLWKLGNEGGSPILCFDGDGAGQRAALRALDRILPLLGADKTVRFAFLPDGQDPDDLLKSAGTRAVQQVVDQAIPLIDMLWRSETEGKNLTTPESRAGLKAAFEGRIAQIADKTVQGFYRSELTQRQDELFRWKRPDKNSDYKGNKSNINNKLAPLSRPALQDPTALRQRQILVALLRHPQVFERLGERLVALNCTGALDKLWQAVVISLENSPDVDQAGLCHMVAELGFAEECEQLLQERMTTARWARANAPLEQVEAGLRGLMAAQHLANLKAELDSAMNTLTQDGSDAARQRLNALRQAYREAAAATLPDDEETA